MATDVSTALPQLDLRDQTIVTVTLDDPGAVIASLVIHAFQTLPTDPPAYPVPLLTLKADA